MQTIVAILLADLTKLGGEAAAFAAAATTFIGAIGPKAIPVITDSLNAISTKTVTPAQAIQDLQDVSELGKAAQAAIPVLTAAIVPPVPVQQ